MLVAALILGACFATAGQFAKQINSTLGWQISKQTVHAYFTILGALSSLILPIIAVALAMIMDGVQDGLLAALMIVLGAFGIGLLRPSYYARLLLASFGVPLAAAIFIATLFA